MRKIKLSIVSSVYRIESKVDELLRRMQIATEQTTSEYEMILVVDCGPDNSWKHIIKML
jgi:dolichol-phosphate mannosyltransferase